MIFCDEISWAIANAEIGDVWDISRSCLEYEKYVRRRFGRVEVFLEIALRRSINSIIDELDPKRDCTIEMFWDLKSKPSRDSDISPSENLETFASNELNSLQKFPDCGKLM